MAVISVPKSKKLTILFNNDAEVDYFIHETELAEKWFAKIKHLSKVPVQPHDSGMGDLSDLHEIYKEFCKFAEIDYEPFDQVDQELCNRLHKLYEDNHDRLAGVRNNTILYKFHSSVHAHEYTKDKNTGIVTGWGVYEGPLTQYFNCGDFYEKKMLRNNLYLPWSELGKKPLTYFKNQEPNDQTRFNALYKPHTTFRAMFKVATENRSPSALDPAFLQWFEQYKQGWLKHHGIHKWDEIDEHSAPLLAITDYKGDLRDCAVKKIITQ